MKTSGMATLGRDAEVRYTPGGDAVANLSLATNYYKKGADNDRETQWIEATLWGKQAEALAPFMVKGSRHCFHLSDIHIEEYENKDGYMVPKLVARVDSVELGPKREGSSDGDKPAGASGGMRRPAAGGATRTAPAPGNAPAPKPAAGFDDMDDDIPF